MPKRFAELRKTPAGYGFILLAAMSVCYGFAYSSQTSIVTNFFIDDLHFSGSQFGYITAVREVGGFFLIFLMMALYRVSLQWLTAGALMILGIGYGLFGMSHGFLSLVPWVVVTSFGFHAVLQTQYALGMSLTTQDRAGRVLGRMTAFYQGGTFAAFVVVGLIFYFNWLSYAKTFIILGAVAFVGGIFIIRFPHLHDGEPRKLAPKRERLVWNWEYRYYYALNLLDGIRQQVFFSFGLWVLAQHYHLKVPAICLVLAGGTLIAISTSTWIGRSIDRLGERKVIQAINVAYVIALGGYALSGHLAMACVFYILYSCITPFSSVAASTYLRKIAVPEEIAPTLAMGVTVLHATALVVPVAAGVILHYLGFRVPFAISCAAAVVTILITVRLDPHKQRSAARIALDEAQLAAALGPMEMVTAETGVALESEAGN
jgi:predicted MFS family arabinose efflux permease